MDFKEAKTVADFLIADFENEMQTTLRVIEAAPPPDDSDACGIMNPADAGARYKEKVPASLGRVRTMPGEKLPNVIDMFGIHPGARNQLSGDDGQALGPPPRSSGDLRAFRRHSVATTANHSRDEETQMITNQETGTRVDEIAAGIYRICTPLDVIPGGFTVNSYLIADDEPLLFHTAYRKLFPITLEAIGKVMPVGKLRWIGGSHFEGDEYGALNDFLAAAPEATPFGTEIGVLTSLNDFAARPARGIGDGEEFSIGGRRVKWIYTPHVPHGWDCGILFDLSTKTLLCGDLFTQPGANMPPVTESEVLTASEGMRGMMDYYAHAKNTSAILERLAGLHPAMLACQHGSAYRGDGAALLRELATTIESGNAKLSQQPRAVVA